MLRTSHTTAERRNFALLGRAAWIAAFAAALAFVATMVFLGRGLWPYFVPATFTSFGVGFVGIRVRRLSFSLVALVLFIFPALCIALIGSFYWPYHAIWMAAVLGGSLAAPPYRWCAPTACAVPVALWALCIALITPIIIAREADFTLVTLQGLAVRNAGAPAAIIVAFVVFIAAWMLVALMWFDRLFAVYANRPWRTLAVEIVLPLSVGWAIATAVGIYQWRVNPALLSPGFWVVLGRATGTILDANPFGAICATWGVVVAGVALRLRSRPAALASAAAGLVLAWAGVWASGSRSAFAVVAFGTLVIGAVALKLLPSRTARIWTGATLIAVVIAGIWLARNSGPFARLAPLRAQLTNAPGNVLVGLWDRDGYGTASMRIIRAQPWTGIGIGLFHNEVPHYGMSPLGGPLPPDNAQNWYRHQLAEFGILGSTGWILWVLVIGWALIRGPATQATQDLRVVRWMLIAFGVVSTVAMPGQDVAVGMMVMTLAFWYLGCGRISVPAVERVASSPLAWPAVWLLALCAATLTLVASADMRPPFRAARYDTDYQYGFHSTGDTSAWTDARAVIVLKAPKPWLKLTYWIEHPNAATKPVRVQIWRDHDRIVDRKLYTDVRVATYVSVPGENKRFVLEVKVDRTFTPGDAREHGLNLTWEFVDRAPQDQR